MSKTEEFHLFDPFGNQIPKTYRESSALINSIHDSPKESYTPDEVRGMLETMDFRVARQQGRMARWLDCLQDRNYKLEELIRKIKSA